MSSFNEPQFSIISPVVTRTFETEAFIYEVFFKLEVLQPSGSFKDRGISHLINSFLKKGHISRLICSSGGNAGHSVATYGFKLGIPVDVYVPTTTKALMINKLTSKGANVIITGENWNAADEKANEALREDSSAKYIPPFDHPLIWEGHSSIVSEMKSYFDLHHLGAPDSFILSVGGGGLLCGVQQGLSKVGWTETEIIAVETEGAASFAAAKASNRVVSLDKISTIASTLGALAVTPAVLQSEITTHSFLVSDKEAVEACVKFADDQRMIVEPACGASLALLYSETALPRFESTILKNCVDKTSREKNRLRVVVIVCGGSAVSLDLLQDWRETFFPRGREI